jgi:NADH dehydrogenase FAD-containing subunit
MSSSTSPQRVVVVGSSFAGLTAALELRKHLHARHEVVVLDPRESFTFIPSLIWLPFGPHARRHHVPAGAALRAQGDPLHQRGGGPDRHRRARRHHDLGRGAAL